MLRHAVYFETLAQTQDETSPEWRSTFAGLVVLRLVDDWLAFGPHIVTTDVTALRAVRATVEAVSPGDPSRTILTGALDTIEQAEAADIGVIIPQLQAYGNTLVYSGLWTLAVDVFELILEHTQNGRQYTQAALEAAGRIAYAHRSSGHQEKAAASYKFLRNLAVQVNDVPQRLNADRGFAKLAIVRGDLPGAEAMLDEVLDTARRLEHKEAYANALHDRAYIALQRGQYETGIRYAYESLQLTKHPANRDAILNDIAAMFLGLGSWRVAQEAFFIIEATSQAQHTRWAATLNLFEIAALYEGVEHFLHYYDELQRADLPPHMLAYCYIVAGQGNIRFGRVEEARHVLNNAITIASAKKFNELLFRAEALLAEVNRPAAKPVTTQSTSVPASVSDVADALTNLRELAHAG